MHSGAPSGGRCRPNDGNNNDDSEGEEHTQGGEIETGKGKHTQDEKGKWKRKSTEEGKGKGKGNGKGTGIVEQTLGGDDISHASAVQLQKEMYEADSDTEGSLERVYLEPEAWPGVSISSDVIPTLPSWTANMPQNLTQMWIRTWRMMWMHCKALIYTAMRI